MRGQSELSLQLREWPLSGDWSRMVYIVFPFVGGFAEKCGDTADVLIPKILCGEKLSRNLDQKNVVLTLRRVTEELADRKSARIKNST